MSTYKNKWPLLFTGASIILFIIFFLIPALLGLYYSLTDYKGLHFIGLANYQELFQDASFYKALFRTFRYVIILVPSIYVVSPFDVEQSAGERQIFRKDHFFLTMDHLWDHR